MLVVSGEKGLNQKGTMSLLLDSYSKLHSLTNVGHFLIVDHDVSVDQHVDFNRPNYLRPDYTTQFTDSCAEMSSSLHSSLEGGRNNSQTDGPL